MHPTPTSKVIPLFRGGRGVPAQVRLVPEDDLASFLHKELRGALLRLASALGESTSHVDEALRITLEHEVLTAANVVSLARMLSFCEIGREMQQQADCRMDGPTMKLLRESGMDTLIWLHGLYREIRTGEEPRQQPT
jgi:hypothetical protein